MINQPGILRKLDGTGVPLLLARLLVGGVMIYMSIPKLQDPAEFLKVINQYGLVPESWFAVMNLIAVVVPWIELLGGIALVLGLGVRGVAALMVVMLIGFTSAIFLRMLSFMGQGTPFFEVQFDCGCGTGVEIIWIKLLKNAGLIAASLLAFLSRSRRYCLSTVLKPPAAQPQAA